MNVYLYIYIIIYGGGKKHDTAGVMQPSPITKEAPITETAMKQLRSREPIGGSRESSAKIPPSP